MRITIDVDFDDDLLDLSNCSLHEHTEIVEYGDRKELVKIKDTDFAPTYNGYEAIDCDYDALQEHLEERQREAADDGEPSELTEWSDYDPDC